MANEIVPCPTCGTQCKQVIEAGPPDFVGDKSGITMGYKYESIELKWMPKGELPKYLGRYLVRGNMLGNYFRLDIFHFDKPSDMIVSAWPIGTQFAGPIPELKEAP